MCVCVWGAAAAARESGFCGALSNRDATAPGIEGINLAPRRRMLCPGIFPAAGLFFYGQLLYVHVLLSARYIAHDFAVKDVFGVESGTVNSVCYCAGKDSNARVRRIRTILGLIRRRG